jgi:hypothetical protein
MAHGIGKLTAGQGTLFLHTVILSDEENKKLKKQTLLGKPQEHLRSVNQMKKQVFSIRIFHLFV